MSAPMSSAAKPVTRNASVARFSGCASTVLARVTAMAPVVTGGLRSSESARSLRFPPGRAGRRPPEAAGASFVKLQLPAQLVDLLRREGFGADRRDVGGRVGQLLLD